MAGYLFWLQSQCRQKRQMDLEDGWRSFNSEIQQRYSRLLRASQDKVGYFRSDHNLEIINRHLQNQCIQMQEFIRRRYVKFFHGVQHHIKPLFRVVVPGPLPVRFKNSFLPPKMIDVSENVSLQWDSLILINMYIIGLNFIFLVCKYGQQQTNPQWATPQLGQTVRTLYLLPIQVSNSTPLNNNQNKE